MVAEYRFRLEPERVDVPCGVSFADLEMLYGTSYSTRRFQGWLIRRLAKGARILGIGPPSAIECANNEQQI